MKIRYRMVTALLAVVLPFGVYAGDADDKHRYKHKSPDEKAEYIGEKLGLDDERTQQLHDIFQWYEEEKQQLKDEKKRRMGAVLTGPELQRLKEMKEKKKEMHKDKARQRDGM